MNSTNISHRVNSFEFVPNMGVEEVFSISGSVGDAESNSQTDIIIESMNKNNPCPTCYKVEKRLYNKTSNGLFRQGIVPNTAKYNCRDCPYKN